MKKYFLPFFLAIAIVLPSIFVLPISSIGENIPTIFINDDAWYKYRLLPVINENEEPCIPVTAFTAVPGISVTFDQSYMCYVITTEDERFLSINVETKRYLNQDGERGSISVLGEEEEYYISAKKAADLLGIGIEQAVFYDKDVVRLYSEEELHPLEIIIDYYVAAPDVFIDGASSGGSVNRGKILSCVLDISHLKNNSIASMIQLAESINITMTFALDYKFAEDPKNTARILNLASDGHSFAISIDKSSDVPALEQAKRCNAVFTRLIKQKTLLILFEGDSAELSQNGYNILNTSAKISQINNVEDFNFKRNRAIILDSIDIMNQTKLIAIVRTAEADGRKTSALNPLCGK